jgi:16S rRNA (guanine966-N2)-methyltransferase
MRVITGTARGRRLKEPQGMDIRPTTDKVKESMFSILQFDIEGRRVLDLFGGTGQLGIEALSRGASEVVFVDKSAAAFQIARFDVGFRLHVAVGKDAVTLQCLTHHGVSLPMP